MLKVNNYKSTAILNVVKVNMKDTRLTAVDMFLVSILATMTKTQPVIKCSKLTIETLEQGVKYVQS